MNEDSRGPSVPEHGRSPNEIHHNSSEPGISLDELTEAFKEMLVTRKPSEAKDKDALALSSAGADEDVTDQVPSRSVLEAMLFVGRPDNKPLTREKAATAMRGLETTDIDRLVQQLNNVYVEDGTPYEIVNVDHGYRLVLRQSFHLVRDKFYGRARQFKLSQAAIEVLAIVAYQQPVTAEQISKIRGTFSSSILTQLVRRQLLSIQRPADKPRTPLYQTTERFLRIFNLEKLSDLPQSEDGDRRL